MSTTRIKGVDSFLLPLALYFIQLFMYPYFLGRERGEGGALSTSPPPQSPPPLCECRVGMP